MKDEDLGPFWDSVGGMIGHSLKGDTDRTLLYVGCEPGCAGAVMYREHEVDVEQTRVPGDAVSAIHDYWATLDPATRWTDVSYSISNGRFHVEFVYLDYPLPESENLLDGFDDRTAVAFERHYEGKPMRPVTDEEWKRMIGKSA